MTALQPEQMGLATEAKPDFRRRGSFDLHSLRIQPVALGTASAAPSALRLLPRCWVCDLVSVSTGGPSRHDTTLVALRLLGFSTRFSGGQHAFGSVAAGQESAPDRAIEGFPVLFPLEAS